MMGFSSCPVAFLFVLIVIFAIVIANVANMISNLSLSHQEYDDGDGKHKWLERNNAMRIDDSTEHLMWFVQVSDIHISIFSDKERIEQFREFTSRTLDIIKPDVVLASGDLTDAREKNYFGSRQYIAEWEAYRKAIDDSGVLNKTTWMDIRGNHDNFNVAGSSDSNLFLQYSVQGKTNPRAYMKQIQKGAEKYTFMAVDASLSPQGPKRPFNFIGVLSQNDTAYLRQLANTARQNGGNYTIWFGHYPTSCTMTGDAGSHGLRRLIGEYDESFAYLCGHLHNLGGTVPRMFTLQQDGFLELELGDWMKFRWFRIGAIDHGLFSFVDTHHNDFPMVLVTNPKNYMFNIPHREHPNLQKDSTHIRILAFSTAPINNCTVRINSEQWKTCRKVSDKLFVVAWNPHLYASGVHSLEVNVVDDDGKRRSTVQEFSLDGTRTQFDTLARMMLMCDLTTMFKVLFGLGVSFCVVPLVFFRVWHILTQVGWTSRPTAKGIVRRLWILSTINRIALPIVVYCLYLTFGPWSIVEVIDGHTGYVFFHGIYLNNGGYIPNVLSCLYGFLQLMLCQLPMTFIFATLVNKRYCKYISIKRTSNSSTLFERIRHAPFIIIILMEIVLAVGFAVDYGFVALVMSPFRMWSVIMNIVLWYLAKNIPYETLRPAIQVWGDRRNSYELESHRDL